jgi:hypothetical protein
MISLEESSIMMLRVFCTVTIREQQENRIPGQ